MSDKSTIQTLHGRVDLPFKESFTWKEVATLLSDVSKQVGELISSQPTDSSLYAHTITFKRPVKDKLDAKGNKVLNEKGEVIQEDVGEQFASISLKVRVPTE